MHIISVTNPKGGAGKSTTSANLAAALALRGKRVLLVDSDARNTATRIMVKPSDVKASLIDVLVPQRGSGPATLDEVRMPTQIEGLDLIPATTHISAFEKEGYDALLRLKDFLRSARKHYDIAIIDTPPNLGMLVASALNASTHVLVVAHAEPEGFEGVKEFLKLFRVAKESNKQLAILGCLCTMYDSRTRASPQVYAALKEKFPGRTFETIIDRQARLSDCPNVHKPIQLHAPKSRGAEQHGKLADEILQILEGAGGGN